MTRTTIDRATANLIAEELKRTLPALSERLGLDVDYAGGSFSDLEFKAKITFSVKETATGQSKRQAEFDLYCVAFGLEKADYGKEFRTGRSCYKIAGIAPRRWQKAVIAARIPDGKEFIFDPSTVKLLLRAS